MFQPSDIVAAGAKTQMLNQAHKTGGQGQF